MARKRKSNVDIIEELKTQLIEDKLYSSKDSLLFSMLVNTYTQYVEAIENIEKEGLIIEYLDDNLNMRKKPNPFYTISIELSKEIFKYLRELYLTPSSRKLIVDANNKKDEDDPLTKLVLEMNKIEKR